MDSVGWKELEVVFGNRLGNTSLVDSVGEIVTERERELMEFREASRIVDANPNYLPSVTSNEIAQREPSETSTEAFPLSSSRGPAMQIRAVIVDDEPLARKRIQDLLRGDSGGRRMRQRKRSDGVAGS